MPTIISGHYQQKLLSKTSDASGNGQIAIPTLNLSYGEKKFRTDRLHSVIASTSKSVHIETG